MKNFNVFTQIPSAYMPPNTNTVGCSLIAAYLLSS